MDSITTQLAELKSKIDGLTSRLGIESKAATVGELEKQAAAPDFWDNPQAAQQQMQQISRLKDEVTRWQKISHQVNDALELAE